MEVTYVMFALQIEALCMIMAMADILSIEGCRKAFAQGHSIENSVHSGNAHPGEVSAYKNP